MDFLPILYVRSFAFKDKNGLFLGEPPEEEYERIYSYYRIQLADA
jgi:hypothetical protein